MSEEVIYLLINENGSDSERTYRPYAEKYQAYMSLDGVIFAANKLGANGLLYPSFEPGTKTTYSCGDVNLSIMTLKVS